MEEKSAALEQVAQAARDGRSIWGANAILFIVVMCCMYIDSLFFLGVLSLMPSTDAVAPPPAARSQSLSTIVYHQDDSKGGSLNTSPRRSQTPPILKNNDDDNNNNDNDDNDNDDDNDNSVTSPSSKAGPSDEEANLNSSGNTTPLAKRRSAPDSPFSNMPLINTSGSFRKPGSALSSPR
jgi:hypothetical protein